MYVASEGMPWEPFGACMQAVSEMTGDCSCSGGRSENVTKKGPQPVDQGRCMLYEIK